MTAFVILHYRAIDTTRSCVKSIRALAGDKHIVPKSRGPCGKGQADAAHEDKAQPRKSRRRQRADLPDMPMAPPLGELAREA